MRKNGVQTTEREKVVAKRERKKKKEDEGDRSSIIENKSVLLVWLQLTVNKSHMCFLLDTCA